MRDLALTPQSASTLTGGLADSLFVTAEKSPDLPVLAHRTGPASSAWQEITAVEFRDTVVGLARGLIASGISTGSRMALMTRTRHEWTLLCYALWTVGAEVVPIHPAASREQVEWILRDSGCAAVLVEDEQSVMTVGSVCAALPRLRHVWQLDSGGLDQLAAQGESLSAATVDSMRRIVLPDSTAVIAYTSGGPGRPLGCALSHGGLAYLCDTLLEGWGHTATAAPKERGAVLAFLPFSQVYGLLIQSLCVRGGLLMGFEPDPSEESLFSALTTFRPTHLCAVPSLLEKTYKNLLRAAHRDGRGTLFERAAETARDFAAAMERQRLGRGPGPGLDLRLQHALYERTVYRKLRAALGGRVRRGASGGLPLHRELALFYEGIGIRVDDAYGVTETSGAVTMQPFGREKSGTVGKALPGTEIQVADDGEVLVRGPSVFQGYVGNETATRDALREGWLATGDRGELDREGYLTVVGGKRDVIVTSSGRSVAPAGLEQRLRLHPLIHQAVVVGDDRPCVGALITLDREFLADWRAALSLSGNAPTRETREENALREEIARAVAAANSGVPRWEAIRVFRVLPGPFYDDVSNGLPAPWMRLRREIVRHYAVEIEAMYRSHTRPIRRADSGEPSVRDDSDNVFG